MEKETKKLIDFFSDIFTSLIKKISFPLEMREFYPEIFQKSIKKNNEIDKIVELKKNGNHQYSITQ